MSKYEFIKSRLKDLKKTQKEMADYLGIEPPHLNVVIKGIRELQANEIAPTAKFLNLNLEAFTKYISGSISDINDVINYKEEQPVTIINKVGYVQAGAWQEACQLSEDEWESIYYPINDNIKGKRVFALGVKGDSMNKIFPPDVTTLICCHIDDWEDEIENGKYIIAYRESQDGKCEATVKKYMKTDDNTVVLVAESTNPLISNIILHPDNNEYRIGAVVIADMRVY